MSASERSLDGRKLSLRNMPDQEDRQVLKDRVTLLMASFKQHDQKQIAVLILDMLASYDVAMVKQLTAAERRAAATVYVRELHGVPTWAVQEACTKIRLGTAPDISHAYKPTPIQVRVLAVSLAQPFKQEAMQIGDILCAGKYVEGVEGEERARVGIKMRTLADELKDGSLRGEGLATEMSEAEKAQRERLLRRHAEYADDLIKREYARLGIAPVKAGDVPVSPALVRQIQAQKKAPAADKPREPLVL